MPNAVNHLRIITTSVGDSAVITDTPTCVTTLPATNVQNISRVRVARTTSLADQEFIFNFSGASVPISAFHAHGHNLSVNGTMRVITYDGENATGNVLFDSGEVVVDLMTLGDYGSNWGIYPLGASVYNDWDYSNFTIWTDIHTPKSVKMIFSDPSNPDGYMEWRRILMGKYITPINNMQWGVSFDWANTHESKRTQGNTLRTDIGVEYRVIKFTIPHILQASERNEWVEFVRLVKGKQEIYLSCFPEFGGSLERDYSILCKLMENDGFDLSQPKYYLANFGFEET